MKKTLLCLAALISLPAFAAEEKPAAPPSAKTAESAARHPLRGVVTRVDPENSTLMVKHEEIPGVMHAMTMMFRVEPTVAKTVKTGDAITALLSHESDGWWLHDVKVVKPKK